MSSKIPSRSAGTALVAFALSLGATSVASASMSASGVVSRPFETHPHATHTVKTSAFAINAELGRAWVEVSYAAATADDPPEVVRVRVPGLSYDASSRTVVFRQDERSVECARVENRGRGLLKREVIVPTGQCTLTHRYVKSPVDNGFEIQNVKHLEVQLTTAPAKAS